MLIIDISLGSLGIWKRCIGYLFLKKQSKKALLTVVVLSLFIRTFWILSVEDGRMERAHSDLQRPKQGWCCIWNANIFPLKAQLKLTLMLIGVHSENVAGGCWKTMEYTADVKYRPSGMCGAHMQHLPTWCNVYLDYLAFMIVRSQHFNWH